MDITMLKSGLWGYKKSSVCEYIARVNEEFSHKLMDAIKDYDGQLGTLNAKIAQLEAENTLLRQERDRISKIMVDAQEFSSELRAKAEAEDKKFRDSNADYNKEQLRRIEEFGSGIDKIRGSIHNLLDSLDKDLAETKTALSALSDGLKGLDSSGEVNNNDEE